MRSETRKENDRCSDEDVEEAEELEAVRVVEVAGVGWAVPILEPVQAVAASALVAGTGFPTK